MKKGASFVCSEVNENQDNGLKNCQITKTIFSQRKSNFANGHAATERLWLGMKNMTKSNTVPWEKSLGASWISMMSSTITGLTSTHRGSLKFFGAN